MTSLATPIARDIWSAIAVEPEAIGLLKSIRVGN